MISTEGLSVDNLVELRALVHMLNLTTGFTLGFVRLNHTTLRQRLVDAVRRELPEKRIIEIALDSSCDTGVVSQMQDSIGDEKPDAVFVYDIDRLLDLRTRQSPAMDNLNLNRDYFAKRFPFTVIFWLPEFAMRELCRLSPDFWSWRSGTYHFMGDERDAYETLQRMTVGFGWSLSLKEKRERRQILTHVLSEVETTQPSDSGTLARVCELLGQATNFEGEHALASQYLQRALLLNRQTSNRPGQARCLQYLGDAAWARAEFNDAVAFFQEAINTFKELHDPLGEAYCTRSLGGVAIRRDDYRRAEELYLEALQMFRAAGDHLGEANCVRNLGDVARKLDRYAEAEEYYTQALRIYRTIPDLLGEANCIRSLGGVALRQDRYSEAEEHYARSIPLYREIGNKLGEANSLKGLGDAACRRARFDQADSCYQRAQALYQEIGAKLGQANCLKSLGDVARLQSRFKQSDCTIWRCQHIETSAHLSVRLTAFRAWVTLLADKLDTKRLEFVIGRLATFTGPWEPD
jgi:tetratricopeptide (TPR) repeat protein